MDRYGRTVAEVYTGGRNVNLEMVRMGAAYAYRQYLSGCNESAYLEAEGQAESIAKESGDGGSRSSPGILERLNDCQFGNPYVGVAAPSQIYDIYLPPLVRKVSPKGPPNAYPKAGGASQALY